MCPACITVAALTITKAMTAGGFTAFAVTKLRVQTGTNGVKPQAESKGGKHGTAQNRVAR
jgi:hypothetical protein